MPLSDNITGQSLVGLASTVLKPNNVHIHIYNVKSIIHIDLVISASIPISLPSKCIGVPPQKAELATEMRVMSQGCIRSAH
jgi:hypothetical protein